MMILGILICEYFLLSFLNCKKKNTYFLVLLFRFVDHGNGLITLRVLDPLSIDSGIYTCVITSEYGCCVTSGEVNIIDSEETLPIVAPEFMKTPISTVAMHGSTVAYCTRVSPVTSKVKWFVCGREITENSRGFLVSRSFLFLSKV